MPRFVPLVAVFIAAALIQGVVAHREAAARLDLLVRELGETVAEAAAVGLRSSLAFTRELERALESSLREKATLVADEAGKLAARREPDLQRFALAAGLRHILWFEDDGSLRQVVRAHSAPAGELIGASADLALQKAAGPLVVEAKEGIAIRELYVPESGLKPGLATAVRLFDGSTVVLVQDAEAFARVRRVGGMDALLERFQAGQRIVFVQLDQEPPRDGGADLLHVQTDVRLPSGDVRRLHVGIDRSPVSAALALQARTAILHGGLLVVLLSLAAWSILRLRASRDALRERLQREERLASLGMFASGVAHEVRNPLNAISLAVQCMLKDTKVDEEAAGLARTVEHEVARLDRCVEEILLYGRARKARLEPFAARELVFALESLAQVEAREAGIELRFNVPAEIELLGDRDLLKGALWNLIRNALRHAPRGTVVDVRAVRRGGETRLEVEDRGPGVSEARRAAIFEPFDTQGGGGTGLGLPLALAAAQAHGGTIEVDSAPEGGAVFRIRLPGDRS